VQDRPDPGRPGWKLSGVKGGNDQGLISGRIPVDPDTDYILTLRHTGSSLFIYTSFYDRDGRRITDPSKQFFWTPCSPETVTCTFQGRVPAGAAFCSVLLRNFDSSDGSGGAVAGSVEFRGGIQFDAGKQPEEGKGTSEGGKPAGKSFPEAKKVKKMREKAEFFVSGT